MSESQIRDPSTRELSMTALVVAVNYGHFSGA